jgi:hypothetical protein
MQQTELEQYTYDLLQLIYFQKDGCIKAPEVVEDPYFKMMGKFLYTFIGQQPYTVIKNYPISRNKLLRDGYIIEYRLKDDAAYRLTFKGLWYMHSTFGPLK